MRAREPSPFAVLVSATSRATPHFNLGGLAVFNLTEKKDVAETERKIAVYEAANRDNIIANRVREVRTVLRIPLLCDGPACPSGSCVYG